MRSNNLSWSTDSHPTQTSRKYGRLWCCSSSKYCMTKQEYHTNSLDSLGRWQRTQRATAQHSSNPHEWKLTTRQSTTMPRPSDVHARKPRTKQSAPTVVPMRRRGERLHSSSSPLPKLNGCGNSEKQRLYIRTSIQSRCSPTYKRGAQFVIPLIFWRCIMKFSVTTSKYRISPIISICSRMHRSKRGEPSA